VEKLILLLADYANVDSSGKLNVLGAFGRIYAPSFPARHGFMCLVVKLGSEWGEAGQEKECKVRFVDEDNKVLVSFPPIPFTIPSPNKEAFPEVNFIVQLRDFVFTRAGAFEFKIFIDDDVEPIGTLPLTVELRPGQ
jgi:hypothetical protein